jgi:hypothetical protein
MLSSLGIISSKPLSTTKLVDDNIIYDKRVKRSRYFASKYPECVPIYLQYSGDKTHSVGDISRLHRYVVPRDNSYGHLLLAFRRKVKMKSTVGMISLVEQIVIDKETGESKVSSSLITTSTTMDVLADKYIHKDGFLYINITSENTFG